MEQFLPLLLEVWRESCRHLGIAESVKRILPVISRRLPLDAVIVRRLDIGRKTLETVALAARFPKAENADERTPRQTRPHSEFSPEGFDRLLDWFGQVNHLARDDASRLHETMPGLLPEGLTGRVIVALLNGETEPIGILILSAQSRGAFGPEHEKPAAALREPFAVALENDQRLRELTQLREAAEAENRSLLSRLGRQDISDAVVGAETGLKSVMQRVELVAPSGAPVLILGETGSGKEVVARAVHARSSRASGPFLRINCGAIPPELIDSELFGHERGSFTGAVGTRKGWFERADGGTLFLDEVAELPLAAQVRLLRVLQDGMLERVGGENQQHVDVRVVAATNRDLRAMVAAGDFREDLWYRIAVFVIALPPLRERVEDIPSLAAHFALRAAKRLGMPPLVPTPEDNDLLVSYPWPGNARELSSVMERAAILGNGRRLEVANALGHIKTSDQPESAAVVQSGGIAVASNQSQELLSLDAAMVLHIEAALTRAEGRVEGRGGAASLLNINPHTLRSRMRKLGIDWKRFQKARYSQS